MKLLKLITSCTIGLIVSLWIIILWLFLTNPYSNIVESIMSILSENIQMFLESDNGFTLLQISFITTIFIILMWFYTQGYKDAREKYDVTKNINSSNN